MDTSSLTLEIITTILIKMESRTDNVSSLISLKTHKVVLSPSMKTRSICFRMEIMFSLGKYKV